MEEILERIKQFRDARDWMQFHDPKNMAISIAIEAGELLELFQWKNGAEVSQFVKENKETISDEIADVGIYLVELADNLGINFLDAMKNKLEKNNHRYPVQKSKGVATKYDKL